MTTSTLARPTAAVAAVPESVGVLTLSTLTAPTPLRAPATLIDGKAVAAAVRAGVAVHAAQFLAERGRKPGLATILIGDDPASQVYIGSKIKACAEAGVESFHHHLPGDVTRAEVLALVDRLNADALVDGILCQLPAPPHLDGTEIAARVAPGKDVDGLSPHQRRPARPRPPGPAPVHAAPA